MRKITDILNLREGEDDREKTLETVKKNISFKGANLWILACAIIVASVGLNVNSTAVIIGAMLISPLMGPIVGAGFALGIYDFTLLKKSLRNLIKKQETIKEEAGGEEEVDDFGTEFSVWEGGLSPSTEDHSRYWPT